MAHWALIIDGAVTEITDVDPSGRFSPDLLWVAAGNSVQPGWVYDGSTLAAPAIAEPGVFDLKAYAADKRWQVETGGLTVAGASVDTSRDSQAMITAAFTYSQAHPDQSITYKASSGWVTLDAATLATIASAVGAHVQACFAAEAALDAAIDAGTITTFAEIDSAAWPA